MDRKGQIPRHSGLRERVRGGESNRQTPIYPQVAIPRMGYSLSQGKGTVPLVIIDAIIKLTLINQ